MVQKFLAQRCATACGFSRAIGKCMLHSKERVCLRSFISNRRWKIVYHSLLESFKMFFVKNDLSLRSNQFFFSFFFPFFFYWQPFNERKCNKVLQNGLSLCRSQWNAVSGEMCCIFGCCNRRRTRYRAQVHTSTFSKSKGK